MSAKIFKLNSLAPQLANIFDDSQVPIRHVEAEYARLSTWGKSLPLTDPQDHRSLMIGFTSSLCIINVYKIRTALIDSIATKVLD